MLVIEAKAYVKGKFQDCAIGVEDGRITSVKKTLHGDERIDYGEMLLLPGAIDIHVHFREPGLTYKEDFQSGSTAAVMGGVTTVFDMPNTLPPTTTFRQYEAKMEIASGKSLADFGIYSAISKAQEIPRLAKAGTPFKLYLAPTTGELAVGDDKVDELLGKIPDGAPIAVHAEDPARFKGSSAGNLIQHDLSRPIASECSSIEMLGTKGRRFHITHVTSEDGLGICTSNGFTTDATPHHMLLDSAARIGQLGKVNPPIREPAEREKLWRAFKEGRIDMIASDHAPHTEEEKDLAFKDAPAGMPGVETMIPLMLRRVRRGELSMERLISAACEKPAEMMGLNKGKIEVGLDADFMVLDLRDVAKIKARKLHSKCGWSAFENWEVVFPKAIYLRGDLIVHQGEIVEDAMGKPVEMRREADAVRSRHSNTRPPASALDRGGNPAC